MWTAGAWKRSTTLPAICDDIEPALKTSRIFKIDNGDGSLTQAKNDAGRRAAKTSRGGMLSVCSAALSIRLASLCLVPYARIARAWAGRTTLSNAALQRVRWIRATVQLKFTYLIDNSQFFIAENTSYFSTASTKSARVAKGRSRRSGWRCRYMNWRRRLSDSAVSDSWTTSVLSLTTGIEQRRPRNGLQDSFDEPWIGHHRWSEELCLNLER